jgi:phosphate transport system protein
MLPRYEKQLTDLQLMISTLLNTTYHANEIALEAYQRQDDNLFLKAVSSLKTVQVDANAIDNEIIKTFALFGPEAHELRELVAYLKMTNEIVQIAEGIKKYARRMKEHCNSECDLTPVNNTIIQLHKSTLTALQLINDCYSNLDKCDIENFYRKVMVEESKNDDLFAILEKEILDQVINETELASEYVRILATLRRLERSCDRSVNIANLMLYAKQGGQMHIYS